MKRWRCTVRNSNDIVLGIQDFRGLEEADLYAEGVANQGFERHGTITLGCTVHITVLWY